MNSNFATLIPIGLLVLTATLGSCKRVEDESSDSGAMDFPVKTASEYAELIEPDLGIVPIVNVGDMVEIPLYRDGERVFGSFTETEIDNPTRLGDLSISGSSLQRYEGRTADGTPMPEVVWVALLRVQHRPYDLFNSGVQLIGYNRDTGATAFFEAGNYADGTESYLLDWIMVDSNHAFSGLMPEPSTPQEFNTAYLTPPDGGQCVGCHQADPFITGPWINAAKIPGTTESVVPQLGQHAPFYVIGGDNWDMRTIHIEGNPCLTCHRVGLNTLQLFETNGYDVNVNMPPGNPHSMADAYVELMNAWEHGVENTPNAEWVVPPVGSPGPNQVVGEEYPNRACFNDIHCPSE